MKKQTQSLIIPPKSKGQYLSFKEIHPLSQWIYYALVNNEYLTRQELIDLCYEQTHYKFAWSTMGDALNRLLRYKLIMKRVLTDGCAYRPNIVFVRIRDYREVFAKV